MTVQEKIQPGYKRTEIGIIPEDWDQKSFPHVLKIKRGQVNPRVRPYNDMTLVAPDHIGEGSGRLIERISAREQNAISGKYAFKPGDLVYSKIRPYLRKLIIADFEGLCSADMYPLTPLDGANGVFCFYVMSAKRFTEFANSVSARSGIPKINRQELAQFEFALPAIAEQRAIAAVLGDADALITSLDALVAKKRDLKQAVMQQLLTGKKRLPGFSGDWELKRIEEIAPLQRGFDLPTSQIKVGRYPVVYSNGILNFHSKFQVKGPGVVTGRSGTIGAVTFVPEDFWPHNTALWVTNFRGNCPRFVFYLYTSLDFERFATGSGVPTLNRNDVHRFEVLVPTGIDEQLAIATIISDMDADLATLEAKRDKACAIKQGMMQDLLTGRIRLG